MTHPSLPDRLICRQCGWCSPCDPATMLRLLQAMGMLRRAQEADAGMIEELFRGNRHRVCCPSCRQVALVDAAGGEAAEMDDENWNMSRRCRECRQPISPERLEALPNADLCTRCQGLDDRGSLPKDEEYCRRCGGIVVLRRRTSGVQSGYQRVCSECGTQGT